MRYQKTITFAILLLLILTLLTTALFLRNGETRFSSDLTQKTHTTFYQNATQTWSAQLHTEPFRGGSSTGIHLEWQKPEETYNHFLMTVTDTQTGWTRTESGESQRATIDFTSLRSDTKYTFVVRACLDPSCTSWIISDQEAQARTPKMTWRLTDEISDLTEYPELEGWRTSVQISNINLETPEGTLLSATELGTFTIERITRVKTKGNETTIMTLKNTDGKILFAQWMNL